MFQYLGIYTRSPKKLLVRTSSNDNLELTECYICVFVKSINTATELVQNSSRGCTIINVRTVYKV